MSLNDAGTSGQVAISGDSIIYTAPESSAINSDSFKYTARDISGATTTQDVTITLVADVQEFYATPDHYTVIQGAEPVLLSVLLNDVVVQGGSSSLIVESLGLDGDKPPAGTSIVGNTILFTPPTSDSAPVEFTYEISNGTDERREARIYITVVASQSSLPLPLEDYFHVAKNSGPHTLDVLLNDIPYPAAGWAWTISAVSSRASAGNKGAVSFINDGSSLSYTPAVGFFGEEVLEYTIQDEFGKTQTSTVTLQVGEAVTASDHFAVIEGSTNNQIDVLANDDILDRFNSDYTISSVGNFDKGGSADTNGSNPLIYEPATSFVGEETFTYYVVDKAGVTYPETVTVTVIGKESDRSHAELVVTLEGVNDVPVVTGVADGTTTDELSIKPFSNVAISDLDVSGTQAQTIKITFDSAYGSAQSAVMTMDSAGEYTMTGTPDQVTEALNDFVFIPSKNVIGFVDPGVKYLGLTLTVTDNYISEPLSFLSTIKIDPINDNPDPVDDLVTTPENHALRIMVDSALLSDPAFEFGDIATDYKEFDATGDEVTLLPKPPTLALLANDGDVDIDDTNLTLKIVAIHTDDVRSNLLLTTSELGATIRLDFRANRIETNIVYDPRSSAILNALSSGETMTDTFYYSVVDSHGAHGVAKVSINVTGVNDVPTATDDSGFTTNENQALDIQDTVLLLNDLDPDKNDNGIEDAPVIVLPAVSQSQLGAVVRFAGGVITYDPSTIAQYEALARNESILDTFTYGISDENFGESSATVSIVVTGVNDTPTTEDDYASVDENDILTVEPALGILSNDEDVDINGTTPDDNPWVIAQREVTTPMGALLNIHTDGSYSYDANSALIESLKENERVEEVFSYVMTDNSRTTASDDSFKLLADSSLVKLPVLINDAVVGASWQPIVSYSADDENTNIVIIESANHSLRDGLLVKIKAYQGDAGYNGVYPITSVGVDHFSITVPYLDDPVDFRGSWIPWFNITNLSESSLGGIVTIVDGQSVNYTPTAGFYGTEEFSYTIEDGAGGQDVATVNLMVVKPQANGFLRLSDDRFKIGMGESAVEVDVLDNDSVLPLTNSDLLIEEVTGLNGASGNVEITNNGRTLTYTPDDLATVVEESFTYTVTAGGDISAQAVVTFQVIDRSDKLNGNDDHYYVVLGSANNLLDVLTNDPHLPTYPVESTLFTVNGSATASTTSSNGNVSIVGNQVSYTPPANTLIDSFNYVARDASGAMVEKQVTVNVVAAAQDFYASGDHYTVLAGSGTVRLPVLVNDGVVMDDGAVIEIVNLGLDSESPTDVDRVSIVGGNEIDYTAPAEAGSETFNYEISIGSTERREATITITVVDSFKDLPVAVADHYSVAKNSGPHSLNVLLNDIPLPSAGWQWTVSAASTDQAGTVAVTAGGTAVNYTPAEGFFGIETFSYTIVDSFGKLASASITVQVGELNASDDQFTVLEGSTSNQLDVLVNDDLLGFYSEDYTVSDIGAPSANGTFTISGDGPNNAIHYSPEAGFTGEESVSYELVDQTGNVLQANVTVTVLAIDSDRSSSELTIELIGVNDIPQVTGITNDSMTDKQSIKPFSGLAISDLDESGLQLQYVTVSFDSTYGSGQSAAMTQVSDGMFEMTATPAAVTAALTAFEFTAHENVIDYIVPGFKDVGFTLTVTDNYIAEPLSYLAEIEVTPINDDPFIVSEFSDIVVHNDAFTRGLYLSPHFDDVDDEVYADEIVWTISGNTKPALFDSLTLNPESQLLVIDFNPNQTGVSTIELKATDRGGLSITTSFTVTLEGPPVTSLDASGRLTSNAVMLPYEYGSPHTVYRNSFTVANQGSLPVESFIVKVSDINVATYLAAFSAGHTRSGNAISSQGVSIKQRSGTSYDVKYDVPLAAGESVVVHLTYTVGFLRGATIRPKIEILMSATSSNAAVGVAGVSNELDEDLTITFNVKAGTSYKLQYSSDLQTWTDWLSPIPVSEYSRQFTVTDDGYNTGSHPSTKEQRFYQLIEVTP